MVVKNKIKTNSLDRASMLTLFGGKILSIEGKYPENIFVIGVNKLLLMYEEYIGWVPYNHFCNRRRELKYKTRRMAGLPERFTGDRHTGYKLGDLATIYIGGKKIQ